VPIIGEEGRVAHVAKPQKVPCKGKGTGRRKKIEESREREDGMCGQATRSAARVKEKLSRRAKKKSRGTL